jgi:flagellar protein FliS
MNAVTPRRALQLYEQVGYQATVEFADQHALVSLLFRALLQALSDTERHMQATDLAAKSQTVTKAHDILGGLRATLDFERGGELASDLDAIYDYCSRLLLKAHAANNPEGLREARRLLGTLEAAWQQVPAQLAAAAGLQ